MEDLTRVRFTNLEKTGHYLLLVETCAPIPRAEEAKWALVEERRRDDERAG